MERNHAPGPGYLGGQYGWCVNKSWSASSRASGHVDYSTQLPYRRLVLTHDVDWQWGGLELLTMIENGEPSLLEAAYAQAYDRFWGKLGARAEMLMNLVELNSSLLMAARRLRQINDIAKDLKRFRLVDGFEKVTGLYGASASENTSRWRKRREELSNSYLETTFGWLPIIDDLKNVVDVFTGENEWRVRGRASRGAPFERTDFGPREGAIVCRYEIGGDVKITNPNVFLANQLGLLNPQVTLWDAVPGSFMLDWFLPVGKFLRSMTNEYGVEVSNCYITQSTTGTSYGVHDGRFGTARGFFMNRVPVSSIPRPSLMARSKLPQASLWHVATLSALAEQSLRRIFR